MGSPGVQIPTVATATPALDLFPIPIPQIPYSLIGLVLAPIVPKRKYPNRSNRYPSSLSAGATGICANPFPTLTT